MHTTLLLLLTGCPQPVESADLAAQVDELRAELAALRARMPEGEGVLATEEGLATCLTGDDLVGEVTAREAADAELAAAIAAEALTRSTDDAAEAVVRGEDDATLSVAITQEVADREAAISAITADYLTSADMLAEVDARAEMDARLLVVEDDYLRSADIGDAAWVVTTDTTLNVPADYATIEDALAWLGERLIAPDATVTIQLADGVYALTETLVVNHRDGSRIEIVGNLADPSRVELSFSGVSGIEVSYGSALGYLDGVTLVGDLTPDTDGVYVHRNGLLACGGNVVVEGFGADGFKADWGGVIIADDTTSTGNDGGYYAINGSLISADRSEASSSRNTGYVAISASYLSATYSASESNADTGYYSGFGSTVAAGYSAARNNGGHGASAASAGALDARGADLASNGQQGVSAGPFAFAYMNGATLTDNAGIGAVASTGSFLYLQGVTESGSGGGCGVQVLYGADAYIGGATFSTDSSACEWDGIVGSAGTGSYLY